MTIQFQNNVMFDDAEFHTCDFRGCTYKQQGEENNDKIEDLDWFGDEVEKGRSFAGFVGIAGLL